MAEGRGYGRRRGNGGGAGLLQWGRCSAGGGVEMTEGRGLWRKGRDYDRRRGIGGGAGYDRVPGGESGESDGWGVCMKEGRGYGGGARL